jgi:hypothetical protein
VDNKNIDISIRFGNGKKDGEVKLWLNKDQVELAELLMVIVIVFILQPFIQILWIIIQNLKYSSSH